MKKFYLGDGVYLATDGHQMVLTTENGIEVTNEVYMDMAMVMLMVAKIKEVTDGN